MVKTPERNSIMIIRLRDSLKLFGVVIMCACAVLPCALFINSNKDTVLIKDSISNPADMALYDALIASGNAIIAIAGGALTLTTVVMQFFYIKNYIDARSEEFGILKALGYSDFRIAKGFWVFGFSIFTGTCIGLIIAYGMMPAFYREMRDMKENPEFPEIIMHFYPELILILIVLPALVFMVTSVVYGMVKLKRPPLELIRGSKKVKIRKINQNDKEQPFLKDLRQGTVKSRRSLVFFIGFASFCYSCMLQMSMSMGDFASEMMAVMILIIGIVLAFTVMFIAVSTVIKQNRKSIAMLRVFGYSGKECGYAVLDGYRIPSLIGFIIGTLYQFGLLTVMVDLFFDEKAAEILDYGFDIPGLIIAAVSFIVIYEIFMRAFSAGIKRVSLKEVMSEE